MGDSAPAFRLYLAGPGPRSDAVERNVRAVCDRAFREGWILEVVDVRAEPERARAAGVLLAPTLERLQPEPPMRWLGDLSDTDALAEALLPTDV